MDAVEEVKARVEIEEVVGQYVPLKPSGSGLKGLCPFHAEKTPSFFVFPARGSFHCFGCGRGGDVLTFVQEYEKLDFREALQRLADRVGLTLPSGRDHQKRAQASERLYAANEAALEYFRDHLKGPAGLPAREYLASRDIAPSSQHAFGLGYAPDSRQGLLKALGERGFEQEELADAGLIVTVDQGSPPRDRFRGRLMFPIRDHRGRLTGFGARTLTGNEPKYLNSPQTEIFEKSRSLFGIHLAQERIKGAGRAVVVEGYFDVVRAHQAGFHHVVAALGTSVTPAQLQACCRVARVIVLALDPDPAGQAAAARTALTALASLPRRQQQLPDSLGRRVIEVGLMADLRIARLPPEAGDPDELIARDPELWLRLEAEAVPAFEFYFDAVVASVNRSSDGWRQEVVDRVLPVIQEFPYAVGIQTAWLERLAEATRVPFRLLQSRLPASMPPSSPRKRSRVPASGHAEPVPTPPRPDDPRRTVTESLVALLLRHPCPAEVGPALAELRIGDPAMAELFGRCLDSVVSGNRPRLDGLSVEAQALGSRLLATATDTATDSTVAPAIRLHLATLRLWTIRRRTEGLQPLLKEIGAEDQETGKRSLRLLLDERADLESQIQRLQREVVARG